MNLKKTLLVGSLFCGVYVFPLYAETPYSESESSKKVSVSVVLSSTKKKTLYRV